MALKLITAPTTYPITLEEAKLHCRIDTAADDALVTALIAAATDVCEQKIGRAIMSQTWLLTLDAFPAEIELTRVPVQSVTSVTYVDPDGATVPLNTGSNWRLLDLGDYSFARIVPVYGYSWPATRAQAEVVSVQYVAGYANAAAVPEGIKQWIKLMVSTMYENRETEAQYATHTLAFADGLLDKYKVWSA